MNTLSSILFWLGIVALIDGSFGLFFEERWQKMASKWNIRKLALVEIVVAFVLLAVHFSMNYLMPD